MSAEILIISLSVILLISPFLSNVLKLPISMVEITLGAVFSAAGFIYHNEMFNLLAEVGFLYLMLLAGMEVNLKELLKMEKAIFKKALLFLVLLNIIGGAFVFIFSLSKIFLVIMPLISIGLMISIQHEIGKKEWLNLAIKIGVLGLNTTFILFSIKINSYTKSILKMVIFIKNSLFSSTKFTLSHNKSTSSYKSNKRIFKRLTISINSTCFWKFCNSFSII